MKWKTILNKCVKLSWDQFKKEAHLEPSKVQLLLTKLHLLDEASLLKKLNPNRSIGDVLKMELWEKIETTIDHWDIRRWESLRELYPKAFPTGQLVPDMTDNGWELIQI
jgi:hypothetical protein